MTTDITVIPSIYEIGVNNLQSVIAVSELNFDIECDLFFGLIETKTENTEISVSNLTLMAFTEYDIPDFSGNQAALAAGLQSGDLYRDTDRKIRVVKYGSGFVLNLYKAWSLLRRVF